MKARPNGLSAEALVSEFNDELRVSFFPHQELLTVAETAISYCRTNGIYSESARRSHLIALVNSKLGLNKHVFQTILNEAAKNKLSFNYHDKEELRSLLDYRDTKALDEWLLQSPRRAVLRPLLTPLSREETIKGLHSLLSTGKVNRSDARDCALEERQNDILTSLFGSYVFHVGPTENLHKFLNTDCRKSYKPDYYDHLLEHHPASLRRECSLIYLTIDQNLVEQYGDQFQDAVCSFVAEAYNRLSNHCYLAIRIKPLQSSGENLQWRLFSDIVLFAEKHREVRLDVGYFRPHQIRQATANYIPELDDSQAAFEMANEGFFYKDCFVLGADRDKVVNCDEHDLLLLFDKNERDERPIPCPSCRSMQIAGNSYPSLGVRSWECQNPICPDRSAYNRGNRYSLAAIIKQQAIKSEEDLIPESSLRRWKLDVVEEVRDADLDDMLVRHFSLHGDTLVFVNREIFVTSLHGRRIVAEDFEPVRQEGIHKAFDDSAFFKRFAIERKPAALVPERYNEGPEGVDLYNGDCFQVLFGLKANSVHGAATSPPYYNARSYTTWPNIYCYLYDMFNSARAVFHVLKPGGVYIFNIFDYFDNENIVAQSAMGKKRMILGSYVINLFRRAGFEIAGNVVWDKGEIEGKRNFNQGNRSPYYQLPFNCWEHTFVFRKPGVGEIPRMPAILKARPVIKMVRGQNTLGHTAPFPADIPNLLARHMRRGEVLLDPYSGSMTTGRLGRRLGLKTISVELHGEYCALGLRLLAEEENETADLFRTAS